MRRTGKIAPEAYIKSAPVAVVVQRLGRAFFRGETTEVARRLLGTVLVRQMGQITLSGRVVETEAYGGANDPASHAFRGMGKRNAVMFGEEGHAYVYFTYGNHYCLNVVTRPAGIAGAVLLRALEPREGIEVMKANRGTSDLFNLTSGPGKLTKALSIDLELDGEDLVSSKRLYLTRGGRPAAIGASARVGVSKAVEREWRFFEVGNGFLSRRGPSSPRTHNYAGQRESREGSSARPR